MKFTIEIGEDELRLISKALDFYSRVGVGQFDVIKDHPTFKKSVEEYCTPKKEPAVDDKTPQGKILEIKDGKALINGSVKNGVWCEEREWKDLSVVKLSTDYSKYHDTRDKADDYFFVARTFLYGDSTMHKHSSWGIFNPKVHDSCRIAFDLHQQIRHEFWKLQKDKSSFTVDAHPADSCKIAGLPLPRFKISIHETTDKNS